MANQGSHTSLVGVEFRGGIILATNILVTENPAEIDRNSFNEIKEISPSVFCLSSGSVDLCALFLTSVIAECMNRKGTPNQVTNSVPTIAQLLLEHMTRYAVQNNKQIHEVDARFILGGRGLQNRSVIELVPPYDIDIDDGDNYLTQGTGSTFMGTYLGANWHLNMTENMASLLVRNAIEIAIHSDIYSGGNSIQTITVMDLPSLDPVVRELVPVTLSNDIVFALTRRNLVAILEVINGLKAQGLHYLLVTLWNQEDPQKNFADNIQRLQPQVLLDLTMETYLIGSAIKRFERQHTDLDRVLQFVAYDHQGNLRRRIYFERFSKLARLRWKEHGRQQQMVMMPQWHNVLFVDDVQQPFRQYRRGLLPRHRAGLDEQTPNAAA